MPLSTFDDVRCLESPDFRSSMISSGSTLQVPEDACLVFVGLSAVSNEKSEMEEKSKSNSPLKFNQMWRDD